MAGLEFVGEVVASAIGIDDSRYQYVIDGMSEEDWKRAHQVNEQRKCEDAMLEEAAASEILEGGGKPYDQDHKIEEINAL